MKKTSQKVFAKVLVIVVAIIILIVGAYFIMGMKDEQDTTIKDDTTPTVVPNSATPLPAPAPTPVVNNTPDLYATCTDAKVGEEGVPVITSLSVNSGSVGTKLEIRGCNFNGFEGDLNAWIVDSKGVKGILYGEHDSTSNLIKVTLKSPLCQKDNSYSGLDCDAFLTLVPGTYQIYTIPWGKESNKVKFTII